MGFYPRNIRLYELALMHKSLAYHEQQDHHYINNERLEFLGDAMLGAIVADILYKHYGNKQEGFLTTLRSKIVCRSSLNGLSHDLGLDKLIRHAGAVTTGHNSFMSGNAFEAFVGAIYLDRGYRYCYRFMEEQVFQKHIIIEEIAKQEQNFKSSLIEWCQKHRYKFEFKQKEGGTRKTPPFSIPSCWWKGSPAERAMATARRRVTSMQPNRHSYALNGIRSCKTALSARRDRNQFPRTPEKAFFYFL